MRFSLYLFFSRLICFPLFLWGLNSLSTLPWCPPKTWPPCKGKSSKPGPRNIGSMATWAGGKPLNVLSLGVFSGATHIVLWWAKLAATTAMASTVTQLGVFLKESAHSGVSFWCPFQTTSKGLALVSVRAGNMPSITRAFRVGGIGGGCGLL